MEFTTTLNEHGVGKHGLPEMKVLCPHLANKKVRVKITQVRKSITLPMYGYYHAVILPCIYKGYLDLGNEMSEAEVHEDLKKMCPHVKKTKISPGGEVSEYTPHLDQISKEQGSLFMDWCIRFASEMMDITIPEPNTQTDLKLKTD